MNKKHIIIFSAAFIVLFLDQLTKFLVRKNFQLSESIPIIKNIFHLTYVTNTGSAFGLFKGINPFFILFSMIVIIAIFLYLKKITANEKLLQLAVGLLLGGTVGNLADRLIHGHVIDFIDFRVWPVFNLGDSAITIGVSILALCLFLKKKNASGIS